MVQSLALEIDPLSGKISLFISFSKVDFPLPLSPISPILSFGFICKLASSNKARPPIKYDRLFIDNISAKVYLYTELSNLFAL